MLPSRACLFDFFFNDTATTEIYTLSLHDALPILRLAELFAEAFPPGVVNIVTGGADAGDDVDDRSEEHTSELQSRRDLVCRLLLEKKKEEKDAPSSNSNSPLMPCSACIIKLAREI